MSDQPLAPVGVTNQVRRLARLSPHLDDLGRLVGDANGPAMYVQPVTHRCLHGNLPSRVGSESTPVRFLGHAPPGAALKRVARQFPDA